MDPNFSRRNVFVYHNNTNEGPLIMSVGKYIEKSCGISMNLVKAREVGYAHTLLVVICPVDSKTDPDVNALLDSSRGGRDVLLVIVKRAAENSHISLSHLSDPLSATTRNRVGSACTLYFSGSQKFKGLKHENTLAINEIKRVVHLALERKEWSSSLPVAKDIEHQDDPRQLQFVPGQSTQLNVRPQEAPVVQAPPVNQQQNQFVQQSQFTEPQPFPQTLSDPNQNVQPRPLQQYEPFQANQQFQQQTQFQPQNQQAVPFPTQTVPTINIIPPGQPIPASDPFLPAQHSTQQPTQQPAQQTAQQIAQQPTQPTRTASPQPPAVADPFDPRGGARHNPSNPFGDPLTQTQAASSKPTSDPFGDPFTSTQTTTSKPSSDPFEDAFGPAENLISSNPFGDAFGDSFVPQQTKETHPNVQRPLREIINPVYYYFEDKSPLEEETVKFLESYGQFQLKRCRQQSAAMVTPLVVFSQCYTIPDADAKSVLNRCRDGEDVYLVIIEPMHSHVKKPATLSASLAKKIGAYGVLSYSLKTKSFDVTDQNTVVALKVREFVAERQALAPEEEPEEDDDKKVEEESSPSNVVIIEGLPESGFDESDA